MWVNKFVFSFIFSFLFCRVVCATVFTKPAVTWVLLNIRLVTQCKLVSELASRVGAVQLFALCDHITRVTIMYESISNWYASYYIFWFSSEYALRVTAEQLLATCDHIIQVTIMCRSVLATTEMRVHKSSSFLLSCQQFALVWPSKASRASVMRVHKDSSCPLAGQQTSLCNQASTNVRACLLER